jgi:hypothetical protein
MKKKYFENLFLIGFVIVLLATAAVGFFSRSFLYAFATYLVGLGIVISLELWMTPVSRSST